MVNTYTYDYYPAWDFVCYDSTEKRTACVPPLHCGSSHFYLFCILNFFLPFFGSSTIQNPPVWCFAPHSVTCVQMIYHPRLLHPIFLKSSYDKQYSLTVHNHRLTPEQILDLRLTKKIFIDNFHIDILLTLTSILFFRVMSHSLSHACK